MTHFSSWINSRIRGLSEFMGEFMGEFTGMNSLSPCYVRCSRQRTLRMQVKKEKGEKKKRRKRKGEEKSSSGASPSWRPERGRGPAGAGNLRAKRRTPSNHLLVVTNCVLVYIILGMNSSLNSWIHLNLFMNLIYARGLTSEFKSIRIHQLGFTHMLQMKICHSHRDHSF